MGVGGGGWLFRRCIIRCDLIGTVCICGPAEGDLGGGKGRDEVVALGGSHPHSGVGLAVQLPPHEEVALLFEVDVAVGAHEAAGVAEFVPGFDHRPPGARGGQDRQQQALIPLAQTAKIPPNQPTVGGLTQFRSRICRRWAVSGGFLWAELA